MFYYDNMKMKAEAIGRTLYDSREIEDVQSSTSYKSYLSEQCRNFFKSDKVKVEKAAMVYKDYFTELEDLQWKYLKKINDILISQNQQ